MTTAYETATLNCAITMLSASATFIAALGAAAANDRIVKSDGGESPTGTSALALSGASFATNTVPIWVLLHQAEFPQEQIALHAYKRSGVVTIQLYQAITAGNLASAITDTARNSAGAILSEITAQVASVNCFSAISRAEIKLISILDEVTDDGAVGPQPGYTKAEIEIEWYAFAGANSGTPPTPPPATVIRPNPIVLPNIRYYFPLDRKMELYGLDLFDSIAGTGYTPTGRYMAANKVSGSPTAVFGKFDWAQQGGRFQLDASGGGGIRGNYATSAPWTATFGGWFKINSGTSCYILDRMSSGGNGQFQLNFDSGVMKVTGYSSISGAYLFAEDASPPYYTVMGTYTDDGAWHHVAVTLTNAFDGLGGGLITVYIDGTQAAQIQGHAGAYFANDQLSNYAGPGVPATAAMSDLFFCDSDASTYLAGLLGTTPS